MKWKNYLRPGRNSLHLREIHSSWSESDGGLKKKERDGPFGCLRRPWLLYSDMAGMIQERALL